ncbi:MAG TPA: (5-formylfuran-3-yl)methyl phosphate synthase [Burkholderiaceae bacterium]|nr:(5-formylfuran-3-yl)methyl phosphate synthase [Burkholderiaceae bacterium]
MTALLASVHTQEEAVLALEGGADIIDLKDPRAGGLGALPLASIEAILARVRASSAVPVSATIGDLADDALDEMARRVRVTARTGVDFVKVGIPRGPHARSALARLAQLPARIVPLFLVDRGLELDLVEAACVHGFPVVMVDTADKTSGTLFDCLTFATLETMVRAVHAAGTRAGLAGSLRAEHVPLLCALEPDIAGFRGALCDGARTGGLNRDKVRALREALPGFIR